MADILEVENVAERTCNRDLCDAIKTAYQCRRFVIMIIRKEGIVGCFGSWSLKWLFLLPKNKRGEYHETDIMQLLNSHRMKYKSVVMV